MNIQIKSSHLMNPYVFIQAFRVQMRGTEKLGSEKPYV